MRLPWFSNAQITPFCQINLDAFTLVATTEEIDRVSAPQTQLPSRL